MEAQKYLQPSLELRFPFLTARYEDVGSVYYVFVYMNQLSPTLSTRGATLDEKTTQQKASLLS
jgi:hypothetical protein